jgi:glycosyltransferase involved in cell wall biosynthesis/peptidoglycan/xylan/chitin deacetylase (PgdA/CDA1 family)
MILHNVYYAVKPYLPWRVRVFLRRRRAELRRRAYRDVWPIDPRAGSTPPNWPGWPDRKRFAVVLTHDVEGTIGLERCEKLMEVERKHGFRSSFNFVPEGEYRVPDALRKNLGDAGFEVGVHGLEHDGKLYRSKPKFAQKAARIREYVKQWNASGFRSPLMQHKLGWLHQLGVEYDASTFDTDPFEPQSDGAGTIFPFWVPSPTGTGYVELPYTLTQDFTLFTILGEANIEIWKNKVDWIVERGGMVLLNTHPDYICFEGTQQRNEFPLSHYEDFLVYLNSKFAGQFWPALPREVAGFYRSALVPELRNTRRKACIITSSAYDSGNRVRRFAEALAKRGDHVDVIAAVSENDELEIDKLSRIQVHRVGRRKRHEQNNWAFAWWLLHFATASSTRVTRMHAENRYDLIHVHSGPKFLAISLWYLKWTGAKVILDIHEPAPKSFVSKSTPQQDDLDANCLRKIERASADIVDHVIVSDDRLRDALIAASLPEAKCSVFPGDDVDPAIFFRRAQTRDRRRFIIMFSDSVQWCKGLDFGIRAFARLKEKIPTAELHLFGGEGNSTAQLQLATLANGLGLSGSVKFYTGVLWDRGPRFLAEADLVVVPTLSDSSGKDASSTKLIEFIPQGLPIIALRTKGDQSYFDDSVARLFEPGDDQAMADAMMDVITNKGLHPGLVARGHGYVKRNSWDYRKQDYCALVNSLLAERFE